MELEGPARWIDKTARELGFSRDDYILLSYGRRSSSSGARSTASNRATWRSPLKQSCPGFGQILGPPHIAPSPGHLEHAYQLPAFDQLLDSRRNLVLPTRRFRRLCDLLENRPDRTHKARRCSSSSKTCRARAFQSSSAPRHPHPRIHTAAPCTTDRPHTSRRWPPTRYYAVPTRRRFPHNSKARRK